ncbi:alpha-amylase [Streptomyces sp. NPDC090057]|uniref:alpha-amylase n=1 Tax=Streptomyces sp. NPDC090057 TaxID=3365935 RepID=UPI00380B3752
MEPTSEALRKPSRGGTLTAVCTASLTLAASLAAPSAAAAASAAPESATPAPSCVAMYQSWRYTEAANDCAEPVTVMVVYQDGSASLCATLAPLAVRTVGEGYLGEHGRADRLETCEPS